MYSSMEDSLFPHEVLGSQIPNDFSGTCCSRDYYLNEGKILPGIVFILCFLQNFPSSFIAIPTYLTTNISIHEEQLSDHNSSHL